MTDITSSAFQIPEGTTAALYAVVTPIAITDLTTGVVGGTGAFDLLMAGMKVQLDGEYEQGRITGAEYTKAYIELTQSAMQTALQFVLGKDQAFWAAQNAQIQAITGLIALETARYTYANNLPLQTAGLTLQNETASYNLTSTLPAQLANLQEQLVLLTWQAEVQRAQVSGTLLDGATAVGGVMGAQEALYNQQITSYKRDAENKFAKIFSDSWITQKTIDSGLLPPQAFTNDSVNEVLAAIMNTNFPGMVPVA